MKYYLSKLISGESLTSEESEKALMKIGTGEVNPAQVASFLMGIQQKGIQVQELVGFRSAMLKLALPLDLSDFDAMDVCGTGGDGKDTFNISTTAAFVVAGAGQKVAKHGNHGVSSAVGSSTVLEYLGVKFSNDTNFLESKIEKAGICYLHAPLFHPAMRFVGPIRKELGIKTFFNILGPILNPAQIQKQLTGVFDLKTFDLYYELFLQSTTNFGIVHALDGYDEVSLTGDFKFANRNRIGVFQPSDIGFNECKPESLSGGNTVGESADIMIAILKNEGSLAQNNAVLANAGLALSVANETSIDEGLAKALESLQSGAAYTCLRGLIA
jgi:anthranilate phosphoribosyltransferase